MPSIVMPMARELALMVSDSMMVGRAPTPVESSMIVAPFKAAANVIESSPAMPATRNVPRGAIGTTESRLRLGDRVAPIGLGP